MGIVNVTPDSFSDGGRFFSTESAVAHARRLVAEGADLLDVGGESTRPGAEPVDEDEQRRRTAPVIAGIRSAGIAQPIFVDTRKAGVAAAALDAGATGINDISAFRDDPGMAVLVAERRVPVVLMHMRGTPATMQAAPAYADVVATAAGVRPACIAVDPGIGFGKTTEHNLELLRRVDALLSLNKPVLIGPSRKRFLGEILGLPQPADRDTATLGAVAAAVLGGAAVVRVHEVAAVRQIVALCSAIRRGRP